MSGEHEYWDEVERWYSLFEQDFDLFKSQFYQELENHRLDDWPSYNIHQYLAMLIPRFREGMTVVEPGWSVESNMCEHPRPEMTVNCPPVRLGLTERKLQRDHAWPNTLGGIKDPTNQLNLCGYHNRQKSNSITNYEWAPTRTPRWIMNVLGQMDKQL